MYRKKMNPGISGIDCWTFLKINLPLLIQYIELEFSGSWESINCRSSSLFKLLQSHLIGFMSNLANTSKLIPESPRNELGLVGFEYSWISNSA